jgi:ankyrin repeat protein
LLSSGVEIDAVDAEGDTALAYAIAYGFLDIAEVLLDAGAMKGRDAFLISAAQYGRLPLVRTLLARGIRVNASVQGATAIAVAASHGQTAMVDFLIFSGADVNVKDEEGQTPLMEAAAAGDSGIVGTLLGKGADREAVDKAGRTAWNHAVRTGHPDVAKLLEGADVRE